jgi:hypothetical protein
MAKGRISTSKPLFFTYMANTNTYLLAGTPLNWQRMNWLSPEQVQWQAYATSAAGYAIQWANKANRTENLRIDIEKLITAVHQYDHDNHLLDRIAAQSPTLAVTADFTTFNIAHNLPVVHGGLPTARKVPTEITVYFSIENGGTGQIICHCKPTATGKRSHLLKGYNVEIFYEILAQNAASPNASQLVDHEVFTKSHFVLNLGAQYSGQKLFIAMRWRHKTNPALNGGLDAIQSITIG